MKSKKVLKKEKRRSWSFIDVGKLLNSKDKNTYLKLQVKKNI